MILPLRHVLQIENHRSVLVIADPAASPIKSQTFLAAQALAVSGGGGGGSNDNTIIPPNAHHGSSGSSSNNIAGGGNQLSNSGVPGGRRGILKKPAKDRWSSMLPPPPLLIGAGNETVRSLPPESQGTTSTSRAHADTTGTAASATISSTSTTSSMTTATTTTTTTEATTTRSMTSIIGGVIRPSSPRSTTRFTVFERVKSTTNTPHSHHQQRHTPAVRSRGGNGPLRIPVRMASPAISYGTRKQLQLYGTSGGTGAGTGGASRSPANDDTGSPKTTTTNNNNKISNSTNNPSTSNRKVVALRIPVRRASPMNGNRKVNNSTTRVTSSVIVASSLSSSSSSPLRGGGVCINNTDQSAREPHVGGLQGQGDITTSSVDSGLSTTATTTTTPNRVVKVVLRRTNSFNLSNESIVLGNATVHPDAMGIITMDSIDKTPTKLMGGSSSRSSASRIRATPSPAITIPTSPQQSPIQGGGGSPGTPQQRLFKVSWSGSPVQSMLRSATFQTAYRNSPDVSQQKKKTNGGSHDATENMSFIRRHPQHQLMGKWQPHETSASSARYATITPKSSSSRSVSSRSTTTIPPPPPPPPMSSPPLTPTPPQSPRSPPFPVRLPFE